MLDAGKFYHIVILIMLCTIYISYYNYITNTIFQIKWYFFIVEIILLSLLAVTTSKWELFDQHEESEEEEIQK